MKIGLVSDTHSHFDPALTEFLAPCQEIWHAGDFGSLDVVTQLEALAPVQGVYGNIDGGALRRRFPERLVLERQGLKIAMIHIGGYPGKYAKGVEAWLQEIQAQVFISGHSHILKILPDPKLGLLHLNPGAFGLEGWHKVKTCLRFDILDGKIENMELLEREKWANKNL